MIRMEIACFLVIAFMSFVYFSAKRERSEIHRVFSVELIVSMVHIFFDGVTIYTVNNMDRVPEWGNVLAHRLFIGTMIVVFYTMCRYIALLVENDTGKRFHVHKISVIMLLTGIVCSAVLPITFITTPNGNYSYGPCVIMLFLIISLYLLMLAVCIVIFWKRIHARKKIIITSAMAIVLIAFVVQALFPLALTSGLGIMLVNLAFYLLLENPDIQLVEQVQIEKLNAEEASRSKTKFLSNMSHEIRTPLNAVVGMTDILLDTPITAEQEEYLNNIKNSGKSLVSIINDILDISKIESGRIELVENQYNFHSMIDDVRMIIENRIGNKDLELEINLDKQIPKFLIGDGQKLRQVIINLMNNAVKYSDSGKVVLTVKNLSKTVESIIFNVCVKDNGIGIKEEDIPRLFHLFERFDTTINEGKEGTGLGLAISQQYVELMGGKIEVRSVYGEGSDFRFSLRHAIPEYKNIGNMDEIQIVNFVAPNAKVLIVDDNNMNCKVAKGLLEKFEVKVDIVYNGFDAIDAILNKHYDIVFMDHMMPKMDGVETVQKIRAMDNQICKDIVIVALTANAMLDVRNMFLQVGMNDFLAKPIDIFELATILRKWLPVEYVITKEKTNSDKLDKDEYNLKGIDSKMGITNAGSEAMWIDLLRDFYLLIDSKSLEIENYITNGEVKRYTVEVHGLKTNARLIGAKELSEEFYMLEQLGNKKDLDSIIVETPKVLRHYRAFKDILSDYSQDEAFTQDISDEDVTMYLDGLKVAVESFDLDLADEAFSKLKQCEMLSNYTDLMTELEIAVRDVSMERIIELVNLIKQEILGNK